MLKRNESTTSFLYSVNKAVITIGIGNPYMIVISN